jgi:hypothetical protein
MVDAGLGLSHSHCGAGRAGGVMHEQTASAGQGGATRRHAEDLGEKAAPSNPSFPSQFVGVGSTNKMVAGGCEGGCAWDDGLALEDCALAIEKADLPAWIEDIRHVTRMDLQEGGAAPERWAVVFRPFWSVGDAFCPQCLRACFRQVCALQQRANMR